MWTDIKQTITKVEETDSLHTWAHEANNELPCSILVNNIGKYNLQPCDYSPEWNGENPDSPPPPEPLPFKNVILSLLYFGHFNPPPSPPPQA